MKQFLNYKITDKAAEKIEHYLCKKPLNEITKEDFKEMEEYKETFLLYVQNEYIWHYDDIHYICDLNITSIFKYCEYYIKFYEIKELDIYVIQESNEISKVFNKGVVGHIENFIENHSTSGIDYIMHIILNRICWEDKNNIFKKTIDNFTKIYKDEKDGEDSLIFSGEGDSFQINLSGEIHKYLAKDEEGMPKDFDYYSYFNKNYKEYLIGYYLGQPIYKIKDKLYYLADDSDCFGGQCYWHLQEVGPKCYQYFKNNVICRIIREKEDWIKYKWNNI